MISLDFNPQFLDYLNPGGCHQTNMIPNVGAVTRILYPDYDFSNIFVSLVEASIHLPAISRELSGKDLAVCNRDTISKIRGENQADTGSRGSHLPITVFSN